MAFIKHISPQSDQDDEQLLALYQASGDLEMLATLYERYMGLVYGVCLKYLKSDTQSQDAVMELFEELIEKVKSQEIRHFKSWLYVVAKNHCLMALRRQKGKKVLSMDADFMQLPSELHPADTNEKEASLVMMEKCLETLSDPQRNAVTLFYLEEKCYQQVAEVTGYPLGKVRSYIQNGRRNLKICMEKEESA